MFNDSKIDRYGKPVLEETEMSDREAPNRAPGVVPPDLEYHVGISEDISDPAWDEFLAQVPGGHHVQTGLWAQARAVLRWKPVRIIVTKEERIIAGAQLLVRSIAPYVAVAYLTKGPVLNGVNPSVAGMLVREIIRASRAKHVQLLGIQPPNNDKEISLLLPTLGFQSRSLELAPTASIKLDLTLTPDQLLMQMKRQTRQNIRRSEREGITVREGTEADLGTFYELHLSTSKRQGFSPYPLEYFVRMWRIFKPLDSINLFLAEYECKGVSALLVVPFGDTVIPKILGWSGLYPERRPNDAVFWAAIRWAHTNGYKCFDMEGIDRASALAVLRGDPLPEPLQHSPDFFKLGFGGQVVLYPGAFYKVFNPFLNLVFQKLDPKIGGQDISSRILDRLRKQ